VILRDAELSDAAALGALGRKAFCAAFEHLYTPDNLSAFLDRTYGEEPVVKEIADPAYIHQLAFDGDALTGFCKMNYPASYEGHSDAANPIVLCQLYTDPARTGEGIGAALMDWALSLAREKHCDAVQLSVWSENFGAQRFYQRYGFAKIADIFFWVGDHRDDEFLYELRL